MPYNSFLFRIAIDALCFSAKPEEKERLLQEAKTAIAILRSMGIYCQVLCGSEDEPETMGFEKMSFDELAKFVVNELGIDIFSCVHAWQHVMSDDPHFFVTLNEADRIMLVGPESGIQIAEQAPDDPDNRWVWLRNILQHIVADGAPEQTHVHTPLPLVAA